MDYRIGWKKLFYKNCEKIFRNLKKYLRIGKKLLTFSHDVCVILFIGLGVSLTDIFANFWPV